MKRDAPSTESDARRVVRLAQDATERLRALRRLRPMTSATTAALMFDELLRRAGPIAVRERGDEEISLVLSGITHAGAALPDLGVRLWPGVLAIDCPQGVEWTPELAHGMLALIAEVSALAGEERPLVLVEEHDHVDVSA